jgi:hypothetical protein
MLLIEETGSRPKASEKSARRARRWAIASTGAVVGILGRAPLSRETSQMVTDLAQIVFCIVAALACGSAAALARLGA